jgi:hypothetical protein
MTLLAKNSKSYNGHKNYNHWNVALWLNNDEQLWQEMIHFVRYANTREEAAQMMLAWLLEYKGPKTPDGAPYAISSIRAAMVGL